MTEQLSILVQNANPAPDPEALLDSMGRQELFQDIRERSGLTEGPVVHQLPLRSGRPRWAPALATAAALIAAVVLAMVFAASLNNDPDVIGPSTTLPAPGDADSPIGLVNAFYAKWNEGDVQGALAYLHPEATDGGTTDVGTVPWWSNYLSYSVAAYGGDWQFLLRDCQEPVEGTVRCQLAVAGEPLYDALAIPAANKQWNIEDGLIEKASILFDMTLADSAVDRYAREQDPVGHAAMCGLEGRELRGELIVYDRPCGEFIAPYRLAYAQELLAGS